MKTKPIPGCVLVAFTQAEKSGRPFVLAIILDGNLYIEVSAKTARAFKANLKRWAFETLPTLYRSDVRVFLYAKGDIRETACTRRAILS